MSRVKEYLALIPIVVMKYVYQTEGVNGSFRFSLVDLSLSEPNSGIKDKQAKKNYNEALKEN